MDPLIMRLLAINRLNPRSKALGPRSVNQGHVSPERDEFSRHCHKVDPMIMRLLAILLTPVLLTLDSEHFQLVANSVMVGSTLCQCPENSLWGSPEGSLGGPLPSPPVGTLWCPLGDTQGDRPGGPEDPTGDPP